MRARTSTTLASVLLLAAILLLPSFLLPPASQGEPQKIGVVKLQSCFNNYKRKADLEKGLEKAYEESKKELKALSDKYEELRDLLTSLQGEIKEKKLREFKELEIKMKFSKEWHNVRRRDLYIESMTKLYDDIRRAVDQIGKAEKYTLVLKYEEPELDPESQENVFEKIVRNPVLYTASEIDITEKVTRHLNDAYDKLPK